MTELFAIVGLGVACVLWFLLQPKVGEDEPAAGPHEGCGGCSGDPEERDCGPVKIGR